MVFVRIRLGWAATLALAGGLHCAAAAGPREAESPSVAPRAREVVSSPAPVAAREAPAPDRQAEAPAPRLTQAERKSGARKPKTDDAPAKGSGFGNDAPAFLLRRAPISS